MEDVFLDDTGVHFRGRVCTSQFADDELVSWCGRRVRACELFSRYELNSDVRGHWSIPCVNGSQPTVGDSQLTEDVALDSFACEYEDPPVTRRDESNISAVELAALHHEFVVVPNVLAFFLKYLMTARPFVAGSLLVVGQSLGK